MCKYTHADFFNSGLFYNFLVLDNDDIPWTLTRVFAIENKLSHDVIHKTINKSPENHLSRCTLVICDLIKWGSLCIKYTPLETQITHNPFLWIMTQIHKSAAMMFLNVGCVLESVGNFNEWIFPPQMIAGHQVCGWWAMFTIHQLRSGRGTSLRFLEEWVPWLSPCWWR